jgi:hypothetical protein
MVETALRVVSLLRVEMTSISSLRARHEIFTSPADV